MKLLTPILCCAILNFLLSCGSSNGAKPSKQEGEEPAKKGTETSLTDKHIPVNPKALLKDFKSWYTYTYHNVRLAQDFIGLDLDSSVIDKASFLDRMDEGNLVPLKTGIRKNKAVYQLFKPQQVNPDIQLTLKQMVATEKEHLNMEGKNLPSYDFTDLDGNRYTAKTTKGKTLLIKCWFINCFACVQEFPELNRFVSSYKEKKDLLFLSLATDEKDALTNFLKKRPFQYAVVPDGGTYISEQLKVTAYPTHILVDKKGVIIKVTNSFEDMVPFIEKEVGKAAS